MHKIEAHISTFLGNDVMIRYFVACSGGVDSMVLLHVFHKLNKKVSALHVNYLLRGEDSEKDQELVEETAKKYDIPCHVKRVDLQRYLLETGGNLQETARKVRYSYFESFKLKQDFKVVLGQHADDQVETFFLNLARGGGIMGLACMLPDYQNYIRPLLPFTKEEIYSYAKEQHIQWREDVSNASNKYNRNKLRNLLIPELKKSIPLLEESILTLVSAFQQTQKDLEVSLQTMTKRIKRDGQLSFDLFDELNEFEIHELLRQLDIPSGFQSELIKLRNAQTGKEIALNQDSFDKIYAERDHFYFAKKKSAQSLPELKLETAKVLPTQFDKTSLYLNPEKIQGVLRVRPWKEGDRMKPIGMKGSKLISDILTDAKVPSHLRATQLILEDDATIHWCIGFAIGREAIAQQASAILKISL